MRLTDGLKSTGNIVQETPQAFFDWLNGIFRFDLDVCALPENAKCDKYYTPESDGLKQPWTGGVWCNPPYGREISKWVEKAVREREREYNRFIVMLLPARTDTKWFQKYVYGKAFLWFVDGRLSFGDQKGNAPFPSVLAVYVKRKDREKCSTR